MIISQNGTLEWETQMSIKSCSFSLEHYHEILQAAKNSGYKFLFFEDEQYTAAERCCLLRHDIDYTPEKAIEFGRIEANLGIQSTYFFQVVAKTYNIREQAVYNVVRELDEMGHKIALHFDVTWQRNSSWDTLPILCAHERKLLALLTDIDIPDIVSFHNPGTYADKVIDVNVEGIHHTYEPRYFSRFKYLSDSQGWYEGCVCKLFESAKYPRIQLLTHPYIWWSKPKEDFIEDMATLINLRRDELTEYMITHHPVCSKNRVRLQDLVRKYGGN